jgi:hypothetical protein
MLNKVDARRRWFGAFFLIVAGGMLAWGLTVLKPFLMRRPWLFVFYWLTCFVFTGLSFIVAALDMYIVRRRIRDERKKLMNNSFEDLPEKRDKRE